MDTDGNNDNPINLQTVILKPNKSKQTQSNLNQIKKNEKV